MNAKGMEQIILRLKLPINNINSFTILALVFGISISASSGIMTSRYTTTPHLFPEKLFSGKYV